MKTKPSIQFVLSVQYFEFVPWILSYLVQGVVGLIPVLGKVLLGFFDITNNFSVLALSLSLCAWYMTLGATPFTWDL